MWTYEVDKVGFMRYRTRYIFGGAIMNTYVDDWTTKAKAVARAEGDIACLMKQEEKNREGRK